MGRGEGRRFAGEGEPLAVLMEGGGMPDIMSGKELSVEELELEVEELDAEVEVGVGLRFRSTFSSAAPTTAVGETKVMKKGVASPAFSAETIPSVVFPRKNSSAKEGAAGTDVKDGVCRGPSNMRLKN